MSEHVDDLGFTGIFLLCLKFIGAMALILIPIYAIYKFLKWVFE